MHNSWIWLVFKGMLISCLPHALPWVLASVSFPIFFMIYFLICLDGGSVVGANITNIGVHMLDLNRCIYHYMCSRISNMI